MRQLMRSGADKPANISLGEIRACRKRSLAQPIQNTSITEIWKARSMLQTLQPEVQPRAPTAKSQTEAKKKSDVLEKIRFDKSNLCQPLNNGGGARHATK